MDRTEDRLARIERQVREDEERIARLAPVVERLERTGHTWAAAEARRVLANSEAAAALWRDRQGVRRAGPAGAARPGPRRFGAGPG